MLNYATIKEKYEATLSETKGAECQEERMLKLFNDKTANVHQL
jgi:hypothetical protein